MLRYIVIVGTVIFGCAYDRLLSELLLLQPSAHCEHGSPLFAPDALFVIMAQYAYLFLIIHPKKTVSHFNKYTVSVHYSQLLINFKLIGLIN